FLLIDGYYLFSDNNYKIEYQVFNQQLVWIKYKYLYESTIYFDQKYIRTINYNMETGQLSRYFIHKKSEYEDGSAIYLQYHLGTFTSMFYYYLYSRKRITSSFKI